MRIGIEAQRLFRKKKHGMDIVTLEVIRELQKLDLENEYFIYIKDSTEIACIEQTKNFNIRILPRANYAIWEQIILPNALKKDRIDILHCTSNTAPMFYKGVLITTIHDIIYLEKFNLSGAFYQIFGNLYRRLVVPVVARKCNHIVTVSTFEKQKITKHFSFKDSDVSVIYNGVSRIFKELPGDSLPVRLLNLENGYMLFLGNTAHKKNAIGVLKAFKIYVQSTPTPISLVITDVNRRYILKILKYIGAKWLLNYIEIFGYVPYKNMPQLYSGAKLFLYPSLRESFGLPILESMACGTPVITSNISAMPEISGEAAILVDPFNPHDIADGIAKLLDNIQAISDNKINLGLKHAQSFAWKTSAKKLVKIYADIYSRSN